MARIIDVDMECICKKASTAIRRFLKKHPNLEYWRDTLEYMFETGTEHIMDDEMDNGEKNEEWCYSIWAYNYDDIYYIAIIERV